MPSPNTSQDLKSEDGELNLADFADVIDLSTFEQILEMDDDEEEREFSRSIVFDFFQQAETTFKRMDDMLDKEDLEQLSALGHFLKGSSATLGLTKVKESCEKIQNYGAKKDESGTRPVGAAESLENCRKTIELTKEEFQEAEIVLRRFYER